MSENLKQFDCDVCISGGGPVGLMLAIGLARQDLRVVLVEQYTPTTDDESIDEVENAFDGRVLALSKGSQEFLENIGVWLALEPYTTAIEHIHVSQKGYLGLTTLHADEVDVDALGYSIQSHFLGQVLWAEASQYSNITMVCPAFLETFSTTDQTINAKLVSAEDRSELAKVTSKLIVGADGTQSKVREVLKLPIEEKSYDAFGILAQIETEQHPDGWAFERFTEEGPVALLPMHEHYHKAVLVCSSDQVKAVLALDDQSYIDLFASKMGERLGRFTQVSPRIAYPLKETYVPTMTKGRAVLMGNASHTQHPVAAQGLNLGIRDIEVFLDMLEMNRGLKDLNWLEEYSEQREPDHRKVMGLTDTLIQVFQHRSPVVGHLRGLGLMAIQAMPTVKKRFSKFAMRGKKL